MRKSLEHVLFWKIKCLNLSSMFLYIFSIHIFSKKKEKKKTSDKTQECKNECSTNNFDGWYFTEKKNI